MINPTTHARDLRVRVSCEAPVMLMSEKVFTKKFA
jgi:hypothetical protein